MTMRLLLIALSVLAVACLGQDSEPRPVRPVAQPGPPPVIVEPQPATTVVMVAPDAPGELVLVYAETGGCAMMGPNCATYGLWSDGSVAVYRNDFADVANLPDAAPEDQGRIDAVLAQKIHRLASATDFPALIGSLGEGTCNGCVDGIDVGLAFHTPEGVHEIDSLTFAIPWSDPLFVAVSSARQAMGAAVELPVIAR